MKAVSEGTDVTAQDTITAERQITSRRIKVWVFNSQNVTPEIAAAQRPRPRRPDPGRHRHRDALAADRHTSSSGRPPS